MATDKIDDAIFSIILQIRKNNNRADVNSIHKHIIKIVDFEDVTKEYLDERIHTLITDGKIIIKINYCQTIPILPLFRKNHFVLL